MKLTVVIPCYNEAERLDVSAIHDFLDHESRASLLLADDGSTDETPAILSYLQSAFPNRIAVLTLPHNRGKAEAVRRGMLEADRLGAEFVGYWDADMATPLSAAGEFCDLLERRNRIQIAWGTRLPMLGRTINRRPLRRLLGRVFSKASALAVGLPIHDALCGAKMFRTGPWLRALFGTPFDSRWIFDVEILARLQAALRCMPEIAASDVLYELPLERWQEVEGSRLRIRDFVRAGLQLTRLMAKTRILRHVPISILPLVDAYHAEQERRNSSLTPPIRTKQEAA